jgi:hypothetical protein
MSDAETEIARSQRESEREFQLWKKDIDDMNRARTLFPEMAQAIDMLEEEAQKLRDRSKTIHENIKSLDEMINENRKELIKKLTLYEND